MCSKEFATKTITKKGTIVFNGGVEIGSVTVMGPVKKVQTESGQFYQVRVYGRNIIPLLGESPWMNVQAVKDRNNRIIL